MSACVLLRLSPVLVVALLVSASRPASAAELKEETVAAYERYIAALEQRFGEQAQNASWLDAMAPDLRARLRKGEILSWAGSEDGIVGAPSGLIHHWRGAVFIPDVTLRAVLAVAQDYGSYSRTYDWITHSRLVRRAAHEDGERYWITLRVRRSASVVTSILDIWSFVEYRYPAPDLATALSNADCIRQVEEADEPDERLLAVGEGSGYLWRANTYSSYVQRDGGVYVDLQTVGLSRGFPPLLGWIIEPIARQIGRGSAADTLRHLREAVQGQRGRPAGGEDAETPTGAAGRAWCG